MEKSTSKSENSLTLNTPVGLVPMIGPQTSEKLEVLGIKTVRDLLFYVPFKYRDTSSYCSIAQLIESGAGMILAQVKSVSVVRIKRFLITKARLEDESGHIDAVWFNQVYIKNSLRIGCRFLFEGKMSVKKGFKNLASPQFEFYDNGHEEDVTEGENQSKSEHKSVHLGRVTPYYQVTEGLSAKWLRSRINYFREKITSLIVDPLDTLTLKEYGICSLSDAIYKLHFPENFEDITQARKRLGFDELFVMSLDIESKKKLRQKVNSFKLNVNEDEISRLVAKADYDLTDDQMTAVKEILADLEKPSPMNRLLNGDVGSGKTIVAVIACLATVFSGKNAIVMAPTTILAQQHYSSFEKLLSVFNIEVDLIISGTKKAVKDQLKLNQKPRVIIGTHAILFNESLNENVGLVIVDEQHRFGVSQREKLKNLTFIKNGEEYSPHYLTMTATPIPRTLTHILYGDTEVSQIITMPKSRIPIKTYLTPFSKRDDCFAWILKQITDSQLKEQAFIIYPLIEESEKSDYKAAVAEFERLSKNVFKSLKVGLLHGRLTNEEKDLILMKFKAKELNVLVATSVVEVGIDIPDATVMVIEDADKFGLAQLHQFRGRVGRGDMQSFCFVIPGEAIKKTDKSMVRLKYFADHASGFDVAEFDLKSRGPGEVYGVSQSGIPDFKIADITDFDSVINARKAAAKMLDAKSTKQLNEIVKNLFH